MIESLQAFVQSFPGWLQWLAVALVAAIPFVESYTGTLIGVAIGLHPAVAATAAIAGNAAAVVVIVFVTGRIRRRAKGGSTPPDASPGRVRRLFERFGIPGVALIGHPTQISSAAMVGFGADQRKVLVWELISLTAWGVLFALISGLGMAALSH